MRDLEAHKSVCKGCLSRNQVCHAMLVLSKSTLQHKCSLSGSWPPHEMSLRINFAQFTAATLQRVFHLHVQNLLVASFLEIVSSLQGLALEASVGAILGCQTASMLTNHNNLLVCTSSGSNVITADAPLRLQHLGTLLCAGKG
jgi:hypothetical protein